MNETEQIEMMARCSREIKDLRAQIAVLKPKADAYDSLAAVIRMFPSPSQAYGEDLAWLLDKRIREIELKRNTPKSAE